MAKTKQPWQNTVSIHGLFSEKRNEASKRYRAFVGEGIAKGQRPDLTGGGLLRNSGGWIGLRGFGRQEFESKAMNVFWATVISLTRYSNLPRKRLSIKGWGQVFF
jgi:hypothetical protein